MNEIIVFENEEFGSVRTIMIDDAPWFVGKDVAEALGYAKTRNAIQVHVDAEDKSDALIQGVNGVPKKMTVLNESGLYSLILSSKLEAAKKFKRWVTSEVLPSIRKNGAYIAEEKFRASKAQFEELISTLEPKAEYYDVIMNSRNLTTISAIAYEYGTSASCLNHLLYRLGIQYKDNDTWYLTEDYAGKGYVRTDIRRSYDYRTNSYRSYRHTRWTQKGVEFLYRLLESIGITPVRSEVDINFIQIR